MAASYWYIVLVPLKKPLVVRGATTSRFTALIDKDGIVFRSRDRAVAEKRASRYPGSIVYEAESHRPEAQ